jgi:GGDEF domain-containing protein
MPCSSSLPSDSSASFASATQWRVSAATNLSSCRSVILSEDEARLLAHRIVRALSAPCAIDGHEVRIGVTIGIAFAPRDGVTFDRLAACADDALYQDKHKGRGSVVCTGEPPEPGAAATAA